MRCSTTDASPWSHAMETMPAFVLWHIAGRHVGNVRFRNWIGNRDIERKRKVARDAVGMDAAHPVGPRITRLDILVNGAKFEGEVR